MDVLGTARSRLFGVSESGNRSSTTGLLAGELSETSRNEVGRASRDRVGVENGRVNCVVKRRFPRVRGCRGLACGRGHRGLLWVRKERRGQMVHFDGLAQNGILLFLLTLVVLLGAYRARRRRRGGDRIGRGRCRCGARDQSSAALRKGTSNASLQVSDGSRHGV